MKDRPATPLHVGFIVDGNRRWARSHGLPAYEGHLAGYNVLQDVLLELLDSGVQYVSLYAFSSENWKRSQDEVSRLMKLFVRIVKNDLSTFIEKNARLRIIGSREGLSPSVLKAIEEAEAKTAQLTGGQVILCFNYGGQREIADAVKKVIQDGVPAEQVTPELISSYLYAPDVPPCDLIVRTSGELRLSNFMLWRAAYSELMFLDKLWPDMTRADVTAILEEYQRRSRRFGK
jgi:undecaprenyl diphosphate synthase